MTTVQMTLTKCSILRTYTNDKHVEWYLGGRSGALDLRVVVDVNHALLVINLCSFGFVVSYSGLLVTEKVADWFHNAAVLDGTNST